MGGRQPKAYSIVTVGVYTRIPEWWRKNLNGRNGRCCISSKFSARRNSVANLHVARYCFTSDESDRSKNISICMGLFSWHAALTKLQLREVDKR